MESWSIYVQRLWRNLILIDLHFYLLRTFAFCWSCMIWITRRDIIRRDTWRIKWSQFEDFDCWLSFRTRSNFFCFGGHEDQRKHKAAISYSLLVIWQQNKKAVIAIMASNRTCLSFGLEHLSDCCPDRLHQGWGWG